MVDPRERDAAAEWPRLLPVGDLGLLVEFGDAIDPVLSEAVVALEAAIVRARLPGVVETIPTYRSLLIEFEPREISFHLLARQVRELLRGNRTFPPTMPERRLLVPVAYGGEFGDDLEEVAAALNTEPHAIVDLHRGAEYRVYMIGFMPGFTYLGGVPELRLPRRRTPRARAPGGSVMIGGGQAAIAALALPTGWYVIGRTPARGFDLARADPFLFRAGDRIRFRRIGSDEFARLAASAARGEPVVKVIN